MTTNAQREAVALAQTSSLADTRREWLTFRLGDEEYAIDNLRVQEIRAYEAPTPVTGAPAFVKGVVNLRGVIVPIIDMRLKMNLARADIDGATVVIVLNIRQRVIGIVVDAVSGVTTFKPDQLCPFPEFIA
jgi:purine-binding chemotaxis protein CheW